MSQVITTPDVLLGLDNEGGDCSYKHIHIYLSFKVFFMKAKNVFNV